MKIDDITQDLAILAEHKKDRDARLQALTTRWTQWQAQEFACRGGDISTEPPDPVTTEARKIDQAFDRKRRDFVASREPALTAELERRVTAITERYHALASMMDGLRSFERERDRLLVACGAGPIRSLADEAITAHGYAYWRERAQRALNPPAPRVAPRPPATAIDLSGIAS